MSSLRETIKREKEFAEMYGNIKKNQDLLRKKMIEAAKEKLKTFKNDEWNSKHREVVEESVKHYRYDDLTSYVTKKDIPEDVVNCVLGKESGIGKCIYCDEKKGVLLFPMEQRYLPLNIRYIKSLQKDTNNQVLILKFLFKTPRDIMLSNEESSKIYGGKSFMESITVRLKDEKRGIELYEKIKERIKMDTELEEKEKLLKILVKQDALIIDESENYSKLSGGIQIKPKPIKSSQAVEGSLEAHINGFRFRARQKANLDLLYSNIRYAFLNCAGKGDEITSIGFYLKNDVLVRTKATSHALVYTKVVAPEKETNSDLNDAEDGVETEEQREKELRVAVNRAYTKFVETVEKNYGNKIKFERTKGNLRFKGVHNKEYTYFRTSRSCISLFASEPYIVIPMEDIQLVYFERMLVNYTTFDMVLIYKDFNKHPVRISTIPSNQKEVIKKWVNDNNVLFESGTVRWNWETILDIVKSNYETFLDNGAWSILSQKNASRVYKKFDRSADCTTDEEDEDDSSNSDFKPEDEEDDEEVSEDLLDTEEAEKLGNEEDGEDEEEEEDEGKHSKTDEEENEESDNEGDQSKEEEVDYDDDDE